MGRKPLGFGYPIQGASMKEAEVRSLAECSVCNQLIGHTGLPLFWTVTFERHGVDRRALNRQAGLANALGSAVLALVMGPDEEMTTSLGGPVRLSVCESCAMDSPLIMAALVSMSDESCEH